MAISDNQLDDMIALALDAQAVVTARQKDVARERLQHKAVRQAMLVPYAAPPVPVQPQAGVLDRLTARIMRVLALLLLEERHYHRAAHNRHFMPITSIIGVTMVIHFYPPVRCQMH